MLNFFRKYQKIFFLITTISIVLSFVFFGTYQAIAPALGGKRAEEKSYVSHMVDFLDTERWMFSRKFFATNFLNDGVISKEFLETGMADLVAATYSERFGQGFIDRLEKEKKYTPYTHSSLPTLSAESIWSMFAPNLPIRLKAHQEGNGQFKERSDLFLEQKKFPPALISQIIRYHEHNNPQFPADSRLAKEDISLFGYHTISDWFGENFVETLAELIIQTADRARKLGYKATKDELLSELISCSQEVFQELRDKVNLPVEDGYGLFKLYLQQIGMEEQRALKIWEDVTLFRRLMHRVGSSALIDLLPLSQFYAFAYENASLEMYQMPRELRLQSMDDLKRFEVYLAAVGTKRSSSLDLPLDYAELDMIEACAPELVGKRYKLSFAKVSKKTLQSKVSVKETLEWECDPVHWLTLQGQFRELAQRSGGTPFDILEGMDNNGRKQVDAFARKQIVEAHPEWVQQALLEAEMDEKVIFLSSKMEKPFEGIIDINHLMAAWDAQDELVGYTQDEQHYYRFLVLERAVEKAVLTYKEALKGGVLDKLSLKINGDALMQALVDSCPSEYKKQAYAYRFAEWIAKYRDIPQKFEQNGLTKQFAIEKQAKTITRSEPSFLSLTEALALEEGSFSEIHIDLKEGAYLYQMIGKKSATTFPLEKMVECQELLSKETRCQYFKKLL